MIQVQSTLESNVQKEIVDYQSLVDTNQKYTNITVDNDCVSRCNGFRITNSGSANAQNIKIVVYILDGDDAWYDEIKNVSQFELTSSPAVIDLSVFEEKVNDFSYFQTSYNNAFRIDIPTLAPGAYVDFNLHFKGRLENVESHRLDLTLLLSRADGEDYVGPSLEDQLRLQKYFEEVFWIVRFNIEGYCDNCLSLPANESFVLTALGSFNPGAGFRVINNQVVSIDSTIRFIWPIGKGFNQISQEWDLEFVNYGQRDYYVRGQ
jgi:hypothetical protein